MTEDTFRLVAYNNRPAPQVKVTGYMDTEEGPLTVLACGHSLPVELTDDLPRYGVEVSCWRCRDDKPIDPGTMWGRGVA